MAYFSNSSEGEVLDAQCQDCPLGWGWNDPDQQSLFEVERQPRPCPVALVQLTYNYDQIPDQLCTLAADAIEQNQLLADTHSKLGARSVAKQLRSTDLSDAMKLLINEQGVCQVRQQLVEIRKQKVVAE